MKRICLLFLSFLVSAAAGCRPVTYPPVDREQTLARLAERAGEIQTMSGRADIHLASAGGETVNLEAAVALHLPDRMRLRAWKFGQAVFDLTMTPNGVWLMTSEERAKQAADLSQSLNTEQFRRIWSLLNGDFFRDDDVILTKDTSALIPFERKLDNGLTLVCHVERKSLNPVKYYLLDPEREKLLLELTLDRYRTINGHDWPMRMEAKSESGRFIINFSEVDLNEELQPQTFVPPRRAVKQP